MGFAGSKLYADLTSCAGTKMHGRTRSTLIGYGLPTDLIEQIDGHGHNVGVLRALGESELGRLYGDAWAGLIVRKIHREPIDPDVVERVERAAAGCCCFCADGNSGRPFQLHHINHYADTQDNSEENLLLVCPTHHVVMHDQEIPPELQKSKRRQWQAVVEIAGAYGAKGLAFPFGAFVALDFEPPPNIADVVRGQPPPPSAARDLCPATFQNRALLSLQHERVVVIRGQSGAGKSTAATAVAGRCARNGFLVFRYRAPTDDRRRGHREVLEFFSVLVRRAVLILDDVNTYLREDELASLVPSIPESGLVIATWTDGDNLGAGRLAAHLPSALQLTWQELQAHATSILAANAIDVSRALREISGNRRPFPVGLGHMEHSFRSHLENCAARASTVSEFLFLLRGERAVGEMFLALVADDRADVPMVYMSIEQIAGFERPVTIEEVVAQIRGLKAVEALPPATPDWVARVFQGMRSGVWVRRVREAYTTLHRDWARALICQALSHNRARQAAEEMLRRDFDVHRSDLERLMRLWSWLRNGRAGDAFLHDWARSLRPEDWLALIRRAAGHGLFALGFIIDKMDDLFGRREGDPLLQQVFRECREDVTLCLLLTQLHAWRSASDVINVIQRADPAIAADVLRGWPPDEVARLVTETPPAYLGDLSWFLSAARQLVPDWCDEVGRRVDWATMARSLSRPEIGDVQGVREAVNVLHRLSVPLTREKLRTLVDVMAQLLQTAPLSKLRYGLPEQIDYYLLAFPAEADRLYMQVDFARVGGELSESSPREWVTLVRLGGDAQRHGLPFAERVLERVHLGRLVAHINELGADYPYELRTLLWFFSFGTRVLAAELAISLRGVVRAAALGSPTARRDLLRAYAALDQPLALEIARELGVAGFGAEEEERVAEELGEIDRPRQRCIERFCELDRTREDYDIDAELKRLGVEELSMLVL